MHHGVRVLYRSAIVTLSCASLALGATVASAVAQPAAHAARTISLNEVARLRLTSKKGFTLNEQGTVGGTIKGTIYIHLRLVSNNRVTAEVNIYPSSGSLTGHGSASYTVRGSIASFFGSLAITRGSGSYARAHASSLRFSGSIQRRNDSVAVLLSGPLSV